MVPLAITTLFDICAGIRVSEEGLSVARLEALEVLGAPREGLFPEPEAIFPRGGAERLVDRFMINLPCTTRLSFDFFRSRVSISMIHFVSTSDVDY
jgi:hypothetical protein